jgi:hypothetical protein
MNASLRALLFGMSDIGCSAVPDDAAPNTAAVCINSIRYHIQAAANGFSLFRKGQTDSPVWVESLSQGSKGHWRGAT